MDDVQTTITEMEEKVDQQPLSNKFPQIKQDFHTAQVNISLVKYPSKNKKLDLCEASTCMYYKTTYMHVLPNCYRFLY